jgi:hypothetical protein
MISAVIGWFDTDEPLRLHMPAQMLCCWDAQSPIAYAIFEFILMLLLLLLLLFLLPLLLLLFFY